MSGPSSSNLLLPLLAHGQAQAHITHNEALSKLDVLVQMTVEGLELQSPPGAPEDGACFGVGAPAQGAWAGHPNTIAHWLNGGWRFLTPQDGWRVWDRSANALMVHIGGQWVPVLQVNNVPGLGIGTSFDATNALAVASPATLFTHAGDDHRMKINRAGAGDTASLLFQSNFSGRAEMGLAGDDAFRIKVSPDGATFHTGLAMRPKDGAVTVPCLQSGRITLPVDTAGLIPTPSAGGIVAVSMVDDLYPQTAHSGIFAYDTGPSLSLATMAAGGVSLENRGSATLTGTTCTDGRSALAVTGGALQIENRHGDPRHYAYTFLNCF
ncbi:MAG: DUF2793 domain-containing protein [Shimia sp.]